MKDCTKCHQEKPLNGFHRNKLSRDGHNWWCKECSCAAIRKWRSTQKGKQQHREQMQRYRANNRLKESMRARLRRAVKSGKVKKTRCAVCGVVEVEAHHHRGYTSETALDVKWLCREHHLATEEMIRRGYK